MFMVANKDLNTKLGLTKVSGVINYSIGMIRYKMRMIKGEQVRGRMGEQKDIRVYRGLEININQRPKYKKNNSLKHYVI